MERQIFVVNAFIADANGTFNTVSGYPKTFDSKNYDNNVSKAQKRAEGELSECWGDMCKRDDRQQQTAMLYTSGGRVLDCKTDGKLAEVEPVAEVN